MKKLKSLGLTTVTTIGVISGLMTIDSWVKDRYSQKVPQTKMEQNYYIYGDVSIDKTSSAKVKELDN